jgi:PilZ domain-containing protein
VVLNRTKWSGWNSPRRRYPRFPIEVTVSVRGFGPNGIVELSGRSFQIGQNGIGAILPGGLEPSDVVKIEVALPGNAKRLQLSALIRYRNGLRYGFEFLGSNEREREIIRHACELLAFAEEVRGSAPVGQKY